MSINRQPDMFRVLPIAERINPLLLAFASSLRREDMPSLQDAELFTWLTWRPSEKRAREYEGSDDGPPSAEDEVVLFRWGARYEVPDYGGKGKVTSAHLLQPVGDPDIVGPGGVGLEVVVDPGDRKSVV